MDNASLSSTRTAPRDLAAEKAVLGAAFLSHGAIEEAMEFVSSNDFYQRAHQIVFAAMVKLNDQEKPIDVLTMQADAHYGRAFRRLQGGKRTSIG